MEYFPSGSPKRCLTNKEKDKVMKILSNTTIQLKVDTFNWTLCALLGT